MNNQKNIPSVSLRSVQSSDLETFFKHQLDPESNHMAAFTGEDPYDRVPFDARWEKIFNSDEILMLTVLVDDQVAGRTATLFVNCAFWCAKHAEDCQPCQFGSVGVASKMSIDQSRVDGRFGLLTQAAVALQ